MPNKHAAIKDLRKNQKRGARNSRMKTHVKALTQQLVALVRDGKKADAQAMLQKLQQAADKAGKTHVFHVNKAARRVSSAARSINKLKT
jgi:ribosomal protein S20